MHARFTTRLILGMTAASMLAAFGCGEGAYEETNEYGEWGPHSHTHEEDFPENLQISSDLKSTHANCQETRRNDAYSAGRNYSITVVTVDGKPMEKATADSFWRMRLDAERAGVILRVNSGYRTMAQQEYLYNCYLTGRCNNGNLAARPGYSRHQSGHAVDINTGYHGVVSWLDRNASKYGFSNPIRSREPWHWEYSEGRDPKRAQAGMCDDPVAPPFSPPFSDDENSPHEDAIDALYKAGLVTGCVQGDRPKFCPDERLTRGQAAALLYRSFKPPKANRDYFKDDNGSGFEVAINAIAHAGITQGCGGDNFCPEERVTRGQFVVMLSRAMALPETPYDFFDDDGGQFYEAAANAARMEGLLLGCSEGEFCGARLLTRGETATLLARALELRPRVWKPFFVDDDSSPHEAAINELFVRGIVTGCAQGDKPRFCPKDVLKRGQMASLLQRALGLPAGSGDFFEDDDGTPHERAINAIAEANITQGCRPSDPTLYCPEDEVSRGQMAVFLQRAFDLPEAQRDHFGDDDGLFYEGAANSLHEAGVSLGCESGKYCGERAITRAEVATMLIRALDR